MSSCDVLDVSSRCARTTLRAVDVTAPSPATPTAIPRMVNSERRRRFSRSRHTFVKSPIIRLPQWGVVTPVDYGK